MANYLLKHIFEETKENECSEFSTSEGGNIIHYATQYSRGCLAELVPYLSHRIDDKDNNGMYEKHLLINISCLKSLVHFSLIILLLCHICRNSEEEKAGKIWLLRHINYLDEMRITS